VHLFQPWCWSRNPTKSQSSYPCVFQTWQQGIYDGRVVSSVCGVTRQRVEDCCGSSIPGHHGVSQLVLIGLRLAVFVPSVCRQRSRTWTAESCVWLAFCVWSALLFVWMSVSLDQLSLPSLWARKANAWFISFVCVCVRESRGNSAFYLSGVGEWGPALARKANALFISFMYVEA